MTNWLQHVVSDIGKGAEKAGLGLETVGIDAAKGILGVSKTVIQDTIVNPAAGISDIESLVGAVTAYKALLADLEAKGVTEAQKLATAAPLVQTIVLNCSFMVGKSIQDKTLFTKAIGEITQGVEDLASSLAAPAAAATS